MTCRALAASFLAVVLLGTTSIATVANARQCVVDLVVLNKNRRVTGDISAECPGFTFHSAPFGNWGVELSLGAPRRDGYQFSGWKVDGGWLQWNSCTTHADFQHGDSRYYNSDGFRSQRAWPDLVNVSHVLKAFRRGDIGTDCESWYEQNRVVVGNVSITVYELDPGSGDTPVAKLSYGTVEVRYQCDGPSVCAGESEWVAPTAGDEDVYAELQLAVSLRME